jgi:sugar lactone lactonase YvrE
MITVGPPGAVNMLSPPRGFADGPAASALFQYPNGMVSTPTGYVYVADAENHRIRRITPWGTVETIAGTGAVGYNAADTDARLASFNRPEGLALDASGNLYVADMGNHVVRKILPGGRIFTVAGTGLPGMSPDGTPGPQARLSNPIAVAVDGTGNLYIGDLGNHVIRKVWKATGAIQTFAGNGATSPPATTDPAAPVGDGGLAVAATLADFGPAGIALDAAGNLFIADTYNHRIRKVNPFGFISTVVGTGVPPLSDPANGTTFNAALLGDQGPIASARLYFPRSVLITPGGQMLIADFGTNQVRQVVAGVIRRIAGDANGLAGSTGDNGLAIDARLSGPTCLALTANALWVSDWGTHRIRTLQR